MLLSKEEIVMVFPSDSSYHYYSTCVSSGTRSRRKLKSLRAKSAKTSVNRGQVSRSREAKQKLKRRDHLRRRARRTKSSHLEFVEQSIRVVQPAVGEPASVVEPVVKQSATPAVEPKSTILLQLQSWSGAVLDIVPVSRRDCRRVSLEKLIQDNFDLPYRDNLSWERQDV